MELFHRLHRSGDLSDHGNQVDCIERAALERQGVHVSDQPVHIACILLLQALVQAADVL